MLPQFNYHVCCFYTCLDVGIERLWNWVWTMRTLNMKMMKTLIKVRQINAHIFKNPRCFCGITMTILFQVQIYRTRKKMLFLLKRVRIILSSVARIQWPSWDVSHQILLTFPWLRPSHWQISLTSCRQELLLCQSAGRKLINSIQNDNSPF